jgi:hypothetical protein
MDLRGSSTNIKTSGVTDISKDPAMGRLCELLNRLPKERVERLLAELEAEVTRQANDPVDSDTNQEQT